MAKTTFEISDENKESEFVSSSIQKLKALRRETHPDGGAATALEKDLKATIAIRIACFLFDAVAGWAVDHIVGVSHYFDEDCDRNDHRHEMRGQRGRGTALRWTEERWTEADQQHASSVLVHLISYIYPGAFADALVAEIDGIILGAKPTFLRPLRSAKGSDPYGLWRCRERAVEHVHRLAPRSCNVTNARSTVARAYGEGSHENIRTWEARLPSKIGRKAFDELLVRAYAKDHVTEMVSRLPDEFEYFFPGKDASILCPLLNKVVSDFGDLRVDGLAYQKLRKRMRAK